MTVLADALAMSESVRRVVLTEIRQGRTIMGIKHVRMSYGWTLARSHKVVSWICFQEGAPRRERVEAQRARREGVSKALGEVLKVRRVSRGWNQREFADRVGVAQGTLSRWEGGQGSCTVAHFEAIANELGVPAAVLVAQVLDAAAVSTPDSPVAPDSDSVTEAVSAARLAVTTVVDRLAAKRRWTREALAGAIGRSPGRVSQILNQGTDAHFSSIVRLLHVLGLDTAGALVAACDAVLGGSE